ncbi:MAG: DUF4157 domain-containing protein [bacterium]|nr:DUF4157 domain-containing protein [bacterium]
MNKYYRNSTGKTQGIQKKSSTKTSQGNSELPLLSVLGNQETGNIIKRMVQAKMTVGSPNDVYEQEADRVADQVVNMTDAQVQSKENNTPVLQAKGSPEGTTVTPEFESGLSSIKGTGSSLNGTIRRYYEQRLNTYLGDVRVHTGNKADHLARSIDASAFTTGHDIVFAARQFNPETREGKKLLGHELTHVLQQKKNVQRKNQVDRSPADTVIQRKPARGRYKDFIKKYTGGDYKVTSVTLKKGGTVWDIARNIGVDTDLLLALNKIDDATKLPIGKTIIVPLKRRPLTYGEIYEAKKVFGNKIDYNKVTIAKDTGWSNAFGFDGLGGIVRSSTMVMGNTIHLHKRNSINGTLKFKKSSTMIHELTHVMQYQRSGYGYAVESAVDQVVKDDAYDYEKGMQKGVSWENLRSEQQAQLVQRYYQYRFLWKYKKERWQKFMPYINKMRK